MDQFRVCLVMLVLGNNLDSHHAYMAANLVSSSINADKLAAPTPINRRKLHQQRPQHLINDSIKSERLTPEEPSLHSSSPRMPPGFPAGLGFMLGLRGAQSPGSPHSVNTANGPFAAQLAAAPAIKQMELMTRNYSDFMRSLAAKYNTPNDR